LPAKQSLPPITHRDLALPTQRAKPFNHPDWLYELKHDGYRVLAFWDGEFGKLLSRRGNDLLPWFPEIAAELTRLPDVVIDGELVMMDKAGKPEFHKLRGRCAIRDPVRYQPPRRLIQPRSLRSICSIGRERITARNH
jgi:ATP-dependent DNA ligase